MHIDPSMAEKRVDDDDLNQTQVTWQEMKDGKDEVKTQQMDIPPDLANGLTSSILENFLRTRPRSKCRNSIGSVKVNMRLLSNRVVNVLGTCAICGKVMDTN